MSEYFESFLGLPLRRVLYYRPQYDANTELNFPGFHDVGQGIEFAFDTGYFFITWNTNIENPVVQPGRMVDWLLGGVFENVTDNPDWKAFIGHDFVNLQTTPNELILSFGKQKVYIVPAEVDRSDSNIIDGMLDNLVVFFSGELRDKFFAQYPNIHIQK